MTSFLDMPVSAPASDQEHTSAAPAVVAKDFAKPHALVPANRSLPERSQETMRSALAVLLNPVANAVPTHPVLGIRVSDVAAAAEYQEDEVLSALRYYEPKWWALAGAMPQDAMSALESIKNLEFIEVKAAPAFASTDAETVFYNLADGRMVLNSGLYILPPGVAQAKAVAYANDSLRMRPVAVTCASPLTAAFPTNPFLATTRKHFKDKDPDLAQGSLARKRKGAPATAVPSASAIAAAGATTVADSGSQEDALAASPPAGPSPESDDRGTSPASRSPVPAPALSSASWLQPADLPSSQGHLGAPAQTPALTHAPADLPAAQASVGDPSGEFVVPDKACGYLRSRSLLAEQIGVIAVPAFLPIASEHGPLSLGWIYAPAPGHKDPKDVEGYVYGTAQYRTALRTALVEKDTKFSPHGANPPDSVFLPKQPWSIPFFSVVPAEVLALHIPNALQQRQTPRSGFWATRTTGPSSQWQGHPYSSNKSKNCLGRN